MDIGSRLFESGPNFDATAPSELAGLSKALEAGYQIGAGRTGGSALRVESLDESLKVVTYNSNHIKLWKRIPKTPAYSTVEEWNELSSYGGAAFPFVGEGELPQAADSSYARRTTLVKYLGVVGEVTHQASMIHPAHGNLIALENQNKILWLLERMEQFLFTGDRTLAFSGEASQWDGLDSLIDPTSVIDLQGNPLQQADIEEASNLVIENFGHATDLFLGTRTMSDLVKNFYPNQRVQLPAPQNNQIGYTVSSMATQGGNLDFMPDVFLRQRPSPPVAATSVNAPAPVTSVTAADNAVTTGDFNKAAPSGTNYYAYAVTACNRFGESAPVFIGSAFAITQTNKTAGHKIRLTITNAATLGAFLPEYFRIYRTKVAAATFTPTSTVTDYSLISQIPTTSQTASATITFDDGNLNLPFTSTAYVGEMSDQVLTFRQLMPMMKMDLAVLSPSFRWMILLYGTPIMFARKKWVRLINIGQLIGR